MLELSTFMYGSGFLHILMSDMSHISGVIDCEAFRDWTEILPPGLKWDKLPPLSALKALLEQKKTLARVRARARAHGRVEFLKSQASHYIVFIMTAKRLSPRVIEKGSVPGSISS